MKSYQQVSNVVLENDKVRVIEIQFGPGEKLPMHSHPNYVIYALTNSRNKFTHPDGTTEVIDLREGQSVWRDPRSTRWRTSAWATPVPY